MFEEYNVSIRGVIHWTSGSLIFFAIYTQKSGFRPRRERSSHIMKEPTEHVERAEIEDF